MMMRNTPFTTTLRDNHGEARRLFRSLALSYHRKLVESGHDGSPVSEPNHMPFLNHILIAASSQTRKILFDPRRPDRNDWTHGSEQNRVIPIAFYHRLGLLEVYAADQWSTAAFASSTGPALAKGGDKKASTAMSSWANLATDVAFNSMRVMVFLLEFGPAISRARRIMAAHKGRRRWHLPIVTEDFGFAAG
jgi:hypothetical protein